MEINLYNNNHKYSVPQIYNMGHEGWGVGEVVWMSLSRHAQKQAVRFIYCDEGPQEIVIFDKIS